MKPLTIEQLKSLEAGDWVWIVDFSKTVYKPISDSGSYYRIDDSGQYSDKELWCHCSAIGHGFYYSDYGKTWTAFKNKEMAEAKGEIVELPCERKTKSTLPPYEVVYINEYDKVVVERFTYENDAKFRLAKLKGEV